MRREADTDAFSFARTFLWREMNSLYIRELEMRKTNSLVFFLNPSKKRKKVPALSKSLHARALSHGEREEARGEKTVEIYHVPLLARVRVLFIRASSFFFLLACVLFLRALVFDDILLSRFQNEDIFRFSLLFFRRKRGKCRTKKKAREVMKERGFFFCFLAGKICLLFCPKAHRHESNHVLCKGGRRGVQLAFAAFYYFVQRR